MSHIYVFYLDKSTILSAGKYVYNVDERDWNNGKLSQNELWKR